MIKNLQVTWGKYIKRIVKEGEGGIGRGSLITFHARMPEKFTRYAYKRENSTLSSCSEGFWKILRFSRNEFKSHGSRKFQEVRSRLTLVHKFTNHARLSVDSNIAY